MWREIFVPVFYFCCVVVNFVDCKSAFLVVGSQSITFKGKYSVAVASLGYKHPETLNIKIYGKNNSEIIYKHCKNVTLKNNALEKVDFDLRDQIPGNYFIKVKGRSFEQTARLNLNTKMYSVLVQTDKAVYKPGDNVQFRVLILDSETKPLPATSVEIYITDGKNNRIKQFDKIFFTKGVFKQSLKLSDEPVLGIWNIHVRVNNEKPGILKSFEVAEYVLPRFELNIVTKSKIYKDEDIVVSYTAKYTYGKDVIGNVSIYAEVMHELWRPKPRTFVKYLDSSSKTTSISLKNDLKLDPITYVRSVFLNVTFTEALTGMQRAAYAYVYIYDFMYLNIQLIGETYLIKPGFLYTIRAYLKDIFETPVTDDKEPVTFTVTYTIDNSNITDGPLTTTSSWEWKRPPSEVKIFKKFFKNGLAELPISITSNVTSITIYASYKGSIGYYLAKTRRTRSNQYIEIKIPSDSLSINNVLKIEIKSTARVDQLNYIIIGRNKIAAIGQLKAFKPKLFKLNLQPSIEMTPSTYIIAFYVTSDGEVISDRKYLNFDDNLMNFVNIDLSKSEAKPGSILNMSIKSQPLSYVGLLGVDQSVLLLKSGNDINKNMIESELSQYNTHNIYNFDFKEPVLFNEYADFPTYETLLLTNANSELPASNFLHELPAPPIATSTQAPINVENNAVRGQIPTRKYFPETWLFDCVDNVKGYKNITRKVPDTITSWIITGFSMNLQHGLGLTKEPSKLTVFMPFFIYLNLPYSIKRGEIISIEAVIFNYMKDDTSATVTMFNDNQEFKFVERTRNQKKLSKTIKAISKSGTPVKFIIKALKVGYITLKLEATASNAGDRIEQKLLVEPEGIPKYVNEAIFIDLKDQNKFKKTIEIIVPQDFIPDSLRIEASLIGDILGPTLDNLDKLIKMPYGCGEQNMLNFVPNIIVLDYLTNANKLTPELESKIKGFMEAGYQKELTYKRDDGSFSIFGKSDPSGSTWLTAFVARSFNQASKYITVDQSVISQSLAFLQNIQADDGSFPEVGVVHNKAMQGGSSSGTGLTSYVLLTFLENDQLAAAYKKTIKKAVDNIVMHVNEIDDVYTMSIVAYTLYLAGRTSTADSLITKLNKQAKRTQGTLHWEKKSQNYIITSLSVETSAYALLAYLQASDADALLIAKWLVKQRNSLGGFESTQDTVVGLFALSKVAAKISGKSVNMKVNLKYRSNVKSLKIDQTNALVLQKIELPSNIRKIEISATGSGIAIVQISYVYHINDLKTSSITLDAKVKSVARFSFDLKICVALNNMNQSNMAVMEISTPSGYVLETKSLDAVTNSSSNIKRIETKNGNTLANVYFDYLKNQTQCLSVVCTRNFDIADQKPASIVVYDYYANDLRSEILYTPSKVILCDICTPKDCPDECE